MLQKIYTVYDVKVGTYTPPFYFVSKGAALRVFTDWANDKSMPVGKHPEDYMLFELGVWDDADASIKMHEAKMPLGTAIEFVRS